MTSESRGGAQRLSVVVPVRNAAPYLPACLESLLAQTRPIDELLLVDDGSTDGSSEILRAHAARHANIRILPGPRHDAAAARNAGIERASGDWLAFADADDLAEPRLYETLIALAEAQGLDMALCNARLYFEGREPDRLLYEQALPAGPISGAEWLACALEGGHFHHAVWMHLYRRSFVERHHLRFIGTGVHEDVSWTTRALMLAPRVAYDARPLYVYRRQPRVLPQDERDRRLLFEIFGAKDDARILAQLAAEAPGARVARAIRWQLVDGGLSAFHKIRQLSSPRMRREQLDAARREGYFGLLWRNATDWRQRRKIASRFLRALALGGL